MPPFCFVLIIPYSILAYSFGNSPNLARSLKRTPSVPPNRATLETSETLRTPLPFSLHASKRVNPGNIRNLAYPLNCSPPFFQAGQLPKRPQPLYTPLNAPSVLPKGSTPETTATLRTPLTIFLPCFQAGQLRKHPKQSSHTACRPPAHSKLPQACKTDYTRPTGRSFYFSEQEQKDPFYYFQAKKQDASASFHFLIINNLFPAFYGTF